MILFTIAVLSLPERLSLLGECLSSMESQCTNEVELLVLVDNKQSSVGAKRNALVDLAKGRYVAFVDDDDVVAPSYVSKILDATKHHPDVISFDVQLVGHLHVPSGKISTHRLTYENADLGDYFTRKPNHVAAWSKAIAASTPYENVNIGEDTEWSLRACKKAKKEIHIDEVLYTYRNNPQGVSQFQKYNPPPSPQVDSSSWLAAFLQFEKEFLPNLGPVETAAIQQEHARFREMIVQGRPLRTEEMAGYQMWKKSLLQKRAAKIR